ncbi:MAG: hypothetical protein E6G90_09385 [Alphaproteobacteria bacterium]|nr:MAG: hypothetical protein E6G90_09385 [Alphaproteobacteria bacterium]
MTASSDATARLRDVWPLLTADTVAYAGITALRALSKDERASLFLTEADNALGRERAAASSDDLGAMCDRLAGDLLDPHKRAPGVPFDAIDAEKAIPACQTAVEEAADEPRFRYQLGRALNRAGKREEAAALIRAVAQEGYPAAQDAPSRLYENGSGIEKDEAKRHRDRGGSGRGGALVQARALITATRSHTGGSPNSTRSAAISCRKTLKGRSSTTRSRRGCSRRQVTSQRRRSAGHGVARLRACFRRTLPSG